MHTSLTFVDSKVGLTLVVAQPASILIRTELFKAVMKCEKVMFVQLLNPFSQIVLSNQLQFFSGSLIHKNVFDEAFFSPNNLL